MLHLDRVFEVKEVNGSGEFEGYLSVFGEIDSAKDVVKKGAFTKTLAEHKEKGRMPALLWQHDTREPIGIWRSMHETENGLFVKGSLFIDDIPKARAAYRLIKEKAISGMSIGFRTVNYDIRDDGIRVITEIDLLEGSLVTFPALDSARVEDVKQMLTNGEIPSVREFETFLRDAGFSRKQSKALIADGYKSISQCDAEDDGLLSSLEGLCKSFRGKELNNE